MTTMDNRDCKMISRRHFIALAGANALGLLAPRALHAFPERKSFGEFLFLEAEGFEQHGGWELDQQSMDQMGSPYLLAHGLGVQVLVPSTPPLLGRSASDAARSYGYKVPPLLDGGDAIVADMREEMVA